MVKRSLHAMLICGLTSCALANPPRLAVEARLDIYADTPVGSIRSGRALGGTIERMSWLSETEQPRTYLAHWPIREFAWREVSCSFVPESNGWVHVDLLGPWEWCEASNALYREEVLWDAISVTGATITNGGFELFEDGALVGWTNPWGGPVLVQQMPEPVDGTNLVNTWHERRVRTALWVTGGVPVIIRAHARAAIPTGYPVNQPITGPNTPAYLTARHFMRGINFGNVFEAPPGQDWGGGPILDEDLERVRMEGFDHIRIPVRWSAHTGPGPDYVISDEFLSRVDAVVTGALARGLGVLLNVHHFDEFSENPSLWSNKLYAIWRQLALYYSNASDRLAFEIVNEPHGQATTEFLSDLYQDLLAYLRGLGCHRTIFVSPGNWSRVSELPRLRLPANDSNIIVTVHMYEPMLFTHQGVPWPDDGFTTTNIIYPGPPETPVTPDPRAASRSWIAEWFDAYNSEPTPSNPCSRKAFGGIIELAREWVQHYGRPIHVGEFGAYAAIDVLSRARYYKEVRELLDQHGIGWAVWDWKGAFYYWNRETDSPVEGLREALFPPPVVTIVGPPLELQSHLAVGKKVRIERSPLQCPWTWSAVDTQTLADAMLSWPIPSDLSAGLLRLCWIKYEPD